MDDDTLAIRVEHLHKDFSVPNQKVGSIKSIFTDFKILKRRTHEVRTALKDVGFTVEKGEFFGIVGRNGSGKSTLLKLLAGIYQPTSGSIATVGKIVPFIELGVGFNPDLSGRDNVYLNGAMLGFTDAQIDAKYASIVEFAELEEFMIQKLKNYSSGMQVRLAFSVATILAESDILLLDEVLAVGDADFQRKCYNYFKNLKKQQKTVIFVTHDMNAVREYCDRAMLINDREVVSVGTSEEIAVQYTKLFNQREPGKSTVTDEERWGDEKATFTSAKVTRSGSGEGADILMTINVEAHADIEDPTYGFIIRNSSGQVLFGTNTNIIGKKQKPLKKGEKHSFQWHIPNIFNSGIYFVNPSIVYNSTMSVADWWEEADTFSVENPQHTPYLVNPKITFTKKS